MNHVEEVKKILAVAANPRDMVRLRLDQEVREIQTGLQRARKRDLFDLKQHWAVRARDLRQALLDYEPQVVHFCGHGSDMGGIFFENELGESKLVQPEALADLFKLCASHVKCVVLNACYSEIQAEAIAQHIDYVVGMKQAIKDHTAIEFSIGFYDALGAGRDIEDAYKFGCNAIALEGISEYLIPTLKTKFGSKLITISPNWDNEAYVSLHLVQAVLEKAELHRKSECSHWYPQFKIKVQNFGGNSNQKEAMRVVDFLVEDLRRNISFLIEVRSAKNHISDADRFKLGVYLQYSNVKFGLLIDPCSVEIFEWNKQQLIPRDKYEIKDPNHIQPVSNFLKNFLDSVANENNRNSHI